MNDFDDEDDYDNDFIGQHFFGKNKGGFGFGHIVLINNFI